jgi:hypothetical protein
MTHHALYQHDHVVSGECLSFSHPSKGKSLSLSLLNHTKRREGVWEK